MGFDVANPSSSSSSWVRIIVCTVYATLPAALTGPLLVTLNFPQPALGTWRRPLEPSGEVELVLHGRIAIPGNKDV